MRLALAFACAFWSPALACEVGPETFSPAPGVDPVARAFGLAAWFDDATERYAHAVLGDAVEAGALVVARPEDCASVSVRLDPQSVFEDLIPRIADLDGDGAPEVIAVESRVGEGARLVIFAPDFEAGVLRQVAQTPYIGRQNRWLAPAGVGDFDGDGRVEIAYVEKPHLARVLRFWRLERGGLREVAAVQGLTNHRIGEAFISSAVRSCGQDEVVLASANWSRTMAVRIEDRAPVWRDLGPWRGLDGLSRYTTCD